MSFVLNIGFESVGRGLKGQEGNEVNTDWGDFIFRNDRQD